MANTTPNNISYPTNASAKKTFEGHVQDTADSVQTALNTKANLSGATFTGNVQISSSGTYLNGFNGTATFITGSSGKVPVIAQGASGQTANLQEWQNSGAAVLANIDSTGRLLLPYQPAFSAYNAQGQYITGPVVANFNSFHINRGNNYSTSTGRFTAPVAGAYKFTFDGLFDNTTAHHATIRLNGVMTNGSEMYTDGNNQWLSKSIIYSLAIGDYVDVYIDQASSRIHQRYGSFTGFFLG